MVGSDRGLRVRLSSPAGLAGVPLVASDPPHQDSSPPSAPPWPAPPGNDAARIAKERQSAGLRLGRAHIVDALTETPHRRDPPGRGPARHPCVYRLPERPVACRSGPTTQRTVESGNPAPHRRGRHLPRRIRDHPPGRLRARRATRRMGRRTPLIRPIGRILELTEPGYRSRVIAQPRSGV